MLAHTPRRINHNEELPKLILSMREINLTRGEVALVSDEDYQYLNQFKWYARDNTKNKTFYARRGVRVNGKNGGIFMHRDILKVTDRKIQVDHINHDTLNNTRENLRLATPSQNRCNTKSDRDSTAIEWHGEFANLNFKEVAVSLGFDNYRNINTEQLF